MTSQNRMGLFIRPDKYIMILLENCNIENGLIVRGYLYYVLVHRIGILFRTIQGDFLLYSYTLLTGFCDIIQFLFNTVITVTSFVWVHHCVFVISIVTCKCAISILQILWFGVCRRY